MKIKSVLLGAAFAGSLLATGAAQAALVTIGNSASGGSIGPFGSGYWQTFGEVFTAPTSGTLTSFSLALIGGVGSLYGGVGTWNGNGSPTNLYTSANVASTSAQTFNFTPNVAVVGGQQYVAYVSIFGDAEANTWTFVALGPQAFGLDYVAYTADPQGNNSWLYESVNQAQFSATVNGVPETSTWVMILVGFAGLGFVGYRRNGAASVAA